MNTFKQAPRRATERYLEQVIEPLASYICASDQPGAALQMALAVLVNEVRQTTRAAKSCVATFANSTIE